MANRPRVGVSRCLLGDAVRYDGDSKPSDIVIDELAALFDLVAVCPEVEAGLGIPRPPVQLTGDPGQPSMTGRDDPELDVTANIHSFCDSRLPQLADLCGFVLKSRSPSCGLGTVPLFIDGDCVSEGEDGVFTAALREHYPTLPLIDEIGLLDKGKHDAFIDRVFAAAAPLG